MSLVPGFNSEGIIEPNISLEENKTIVVSKKKKKYNFDKLISLPTDDENMGMDKIFNDEAFKGIF